VADLQQQEKESHLLSRARIRRNGER
jgi:hypothetical protein